MDIIEIRGFTGDAKCQIFYGDRESIIHVLRDCPYAKCFWDNTQACTLIHDIYSMDICARLEKNYGINTPCNDLIPWNMFFSFAIWSLQLHKNKVVFKNSLPNHKLNKEALVAANRGGKCQMGGLSYI